MMPEHTGTERSHKAHEPRGPWAALDSPLVKILAAFSWVLLVALFTMAYGNVTSSLKDSQADRADLRKLFAEREQSRAGTEATLTAEMRNLTVAVNRLTEKLDREELRRIK